MLIRTHAAFLHGIEGGGRRLTMEELRVSLARLGYEGVATWRDTGDIAFATDPDADAALLERRIGDALEDEFGWPVSAIVRTAAHVLVIATDVPFSAAQVEVTAGRVQVVFMRDEPAPESIVEVMALATDEDELQWTGRELWWLPRGEVGDSRLRVHHLEGVLGVVTARSHRSVTGLLARHLAP